MRFIRGCVRFLTDKSGATAIEYSILVMMISVAAIVGFSSIGVTLSDIANLLAGKLQHYSS